MQRFQISILSGIIIAAVMSSGQAALAEDVLSANYIMPGCRSLANKDGNTGTFISGLCAGNIEKLIDLETN